MKTFKIHLIRHGLTEGNLKGQYVGKSDIPITTDGIEELEMLKQKYGYPEGELFFASPLKRCSQTLEILYPEVDPIIINGLSECDFGDFEGKTYDELKDDEVFKQWATTGGIAPPGGECSADFVERIIAAFDLVVETIISSNISESVICAHGGVFMMLLATFATPKKQMVEWMCSNGRGFTIEITPYVWMSEGTFEVISELPIGSGGEKDNSINPVLQKKGMVTDE